MTDCLFHTTAPAQSAYRAKSFLRTFLFSWESGPCSAEGFPVMWQKGQWAPEVVLSYRFWRRRFGGDPHILGQTVRLNSYPFTVIGISPREFFSLVVGLEPELRVPQMPPGQSLSQVNCSALLTPKSWLGSTRGSESYRRKPPRTRCVSSSCATTLPINMR